MIIKQIIKSRTTITIATESKSIVLPIALFKSMTIEQLTNILSA